MAIAVETQHGVDYVFEDARTREAAFLRDMTDEHHGEIALLRLADEAVRALAHLHRRSGSRTERGIVHGLDRVDDDETRLHAIGLREHVAELGFGCEPQLGRE